MKVLHIESGALGAAVASRQLSAVAVRSTRNNNPRPSVPYRDIAAALPEQRLELLSEELA